MRITIKRARQREYASESRQRAKDRGRPDKAAVSRAALEVWLDRAGRRRQFASILAELIGAGFDKDESLDVLDRLVDDDAFARVLSLTNVDTTDHEESTDR